MRYIEFDPVRNYYERLVFEYIVEKYGDSGLDNDLLQDVACLALNQLPARYVRFPVDVAFYISSKELVEIRNAVDNAVQRAMEFVRGNPRRSDTGGLPR